MEVTAHRPVTRGPMLIADVLFKLFAMRDLLSPGDLASAALVHTTWLGAARRWLYTSVDITLPNIHFADAMWNRPALRRLVRRLNIELYWPLNSQLCAALGWPERNELVYSFGWLHLDGVNVTHLSVNTGIHWIPAVVVMGIFEGSYFLDQVRNLKLRGLHFSLDVPVGVTSLDLAASSYLRFQRTIPTHLQSLCIIDVAQLPLHFLSGVSPTVTRLELHFSLLYKNWRAPDLPPWRWPTFPALRDLTLIGSRGENLRIGGSALQPEILTISLCLFETNRIPQQTTTIKLEPPGVLTYVSAHRFLLQRSAMGLKCKRMIISCLVEDEALGVLLDAGMDVSLACLIEPDHVHLYD